MLSVASIPFILPDPCEAKGFLQFPLKSPLGNTYHFMRVGTTLLEEEDIWSTNPLYLTNSEDSLSLKGIEEVKTSLRQIGQDEKPTLIRYSLAASATQSANIASTELKVGYDRVIPEFTLMDPRGIGAFDMLSKVETVPAVWAMDALEAGVDGVGGRPPPKTDGTPNETLSDQYVRLRDFLSIVESRRTDETILLIFPDGTGPALLSAMMAGIPLDRVHELEFGPGEIRKNVTPESVRALYESVRDSPNYIATVEKGKGALGQLRSSEGDIVSLKDRRSDDEERAIEAVVKRNREVERKRIEDSRERVIAERSINKQKANNEPERKSEGLTLSVDREHEASLELNAKRAILTIGGVGLGLVGVNTVTGATGESGKVDRQNNRSEIDVELQEGGTAVSDSQINASGKEGGSFMPSQSDDKEGRSDVKKEKDSSVPMLVKSKEQDDHELWLQRIREMIAEEEHTNNQSGS